MQGPMTTVRLGWGHDITRARAVWMPALLALVVYVPALDNGFALDDRPIAQDNVTVRTVGRALGAFFDPYWPPRDGAGQYRPLTILSLAVDWTIAGGNPVWIHGVNLVLHGLVVALLVLVLMRWLPPPAALIAGIVFAVHPVHVEAVASVVGRSELLVAIALFGAILAARRYRRAPTPGPKGWWLGATLACVGLGLFSKEHGVVAIAVLALDHWLDGERPPGKQAALYLSVTAMTLGWLYLFRGIAGSYVHLAEAPTIRGLSFGERLMTMIPAQLHVIRLLVWPMDLAADYDPLVIPRIVHVTWTAGVAAATVGGIVLLSLIGARRAPAVTFAVWLGIIAYSPTSNILFPSGIMLSERNLYLAAAAPAVVLGLLPGLVVRRGERRLAMGVVAILVAAFGVRTWTRVPFWKDTATVVIGDFIAHSENYRARSRMATLYERVGNVPAAFAEGMVAAAIFPDDAFLSVTTVPLGLKMGYVELAAAEAERSLRLAPEDDGLQRMVTLARLTLGRLEDARRLARVSLEEHPTSEAAVGAYRAVLDSLDGPAWAESTMEARSAWIAGRLGTAADTLRAGLDALTRVESVDPEWCWDLWFARSLVARFKDVRGAKRGDASMCDGRVTPRQ